MKKEKNNWIFMNYKKIGVFLLVLIVFNIIFFNSFYNGKFSENRVVNLAEDKKEISFNEASRPVQEKGEVIKKGALWISKKDITGDILNVNQEKGFASENINLLAGSVLFSDNFNRPDGGLGPNWNVLGSMRISSGAVATDQSAASFALYNQIPPSADYYSQVKIFVPTDPDTASSGPIVRYVDINNYYELRGSPPSNAINLYKIIGGVRILLKSYFLPAPSIYPAILKLSVIGDQLTMTVTDSFNNVVVQDTYIDNNNPILSVGRGGFFTSVGPLALGNQLVDDWELGTESGYCGDGVVDLGEVCDEGILNGQIGHCNTACSGLTRTFCDNFNRVNNQNLGSDWLEVIDNFEIYNNVLAMVSGFQDSVALVNRADYISLFNSAQAVACYDTYTGDINFQDACGLIARYVDQNNYYYVTYTRPAGVVSLNKKVNGVVKNIATVSGVWGIIGSKELKLLVNGNNLLVYFDGNNIISEVDTDLQNPDSRIGVYGYGEDSHANRVFFDDYKALSQPVTDIVCSVCGNGILEAGEQCDDGVNNGKINFCNPSCTGIVKCLSNNDCNDNNACNGIETCNLATFTCVSGTPVDCSALNNQCNVGTCNPTDGSCYSSPKVFLFSDNFNRIDGALGASWVDLTPGWSIVNNKASSQTIGSVVKWNAAFPSADYWVQGTLDPGVSGAVTNGIALRIADGNNWYGVDGTKTGDKVYLYKRVGGVETVLATYSILGWPKVVRLAATGASLVVTIDGIPQQPVIAGALSAVGFGGLAERSGGANPGTVDDWSASGLLACDDGVSCTINDQCNLAGGCVGVVDNSLCNNGLFCDGVETCDVTLGCQAGIIVNCNDEFTCTIDSCNEATDSCNNLPIDSLCDDGLFCNGNEVCDAVLGCQVGVLPVADDGVVCTIDGCDEVNQITHTPDNSLCNDNVLCTADICNPTTGCSSNPIDNDLDTYSICPGVNFDCNDDNVNINPGASEICTDGIDNNCNNECDYDTSLPCTLHGDITCPVGVTSISASNNNPFENTNIEVRCTSSIAGVNSIQAYLDATSCIFDRWEINDAVFICNTGGVGIKTLKCTVDLSKSYQLGNDQIQQINVKSSVCSDYNIQVECPGNICEWCSSCQGTKSSGIAKDACVNLGACSYICIAGSCGASCDQNIGCSSTDCDYLDGCVGRDYYDYSDVTNLCLSDCGCESNLCDLPTITFDDPNCISLTTTTLPHANLTLYLRNSTAQSSFTGLYTNITILTNESFNITSKDEYPADVNMTLYVMNYAGVNVSFNYSKSFLENFTTFWTTGSFLINITWEGNLTMFGNSTALYVTVLATTTTTSSTTSTSSSTTSSTTESTTTSTSTSSTTFGTAETTTTTSSSTSSTTAISQPPSGGDGGGRKIEGGIRYACNDAEDNDKDGYCDLLDSTCIDGSIPGDRGCYSIFDDNETNFIEPPYLKPPEMCKVCWGNKDLSNLNVLSEFFNYQDYFNNVYKSNNIECCQCNYNNIQDQGEEGVDCGGVCPRCEVKKFIWPVCEINFWLVIIAWLLLLIQFLLGKLNRLSSCMNGIYALLYVSLDNVTLNCNLLNILVGMIIIYQLYIISRKREISFL